MITEKGSIKAEFTACEKAERQYSKTLFIISIVCLALGSAGIGVFLVIDILSVFNIIKEPALWILVILAVPFAFGLIFIIGLRKAYKGLRNNPQPGRFEYEFFADYLTLETPAVGEASAPLKVYYPQIIKRKETKDYIFASHDMTNIVTVDKNTLTEGEVNALREALGLPVKSGERVALPKGEADGNGGKQEQDAEKEDKN